MGRLGLALVVLLGFVGPIPTRAAWGQLHENGCLKPRGETAQGQYVSPRGNLCQNLQQYTLEKVGRQMAAGEVPVPGKAFLLSAILPGAGQWFLGQSRWPAYLAVETWAWIQFLDWRREGKNLRRKYKDLAWFVARRVSTGSRTDAGWDYYESLSHFPSSGAYDRDPLTPGIQPEGNPSTFNGSIWVLAQEIYLPEDPDHPVEDGSEALERAHGYYSSRAYAPNLAWDWGANTLHQEEYATLIREADEALRSSTGMIGVILANHLLSAVDALVSGRLGIAGESEPSMEFLLLPGPLYTTEVAFQIRLPNPLAYVH